MRALAACLALFAAPAFAVGIESVELLRDDGGEPGDAVEHFTPGDRVQHFGIQLDELKVGNHNFTIEFHALETMSGDSGKITSVDAGGLIANTISAQVSLPRDWPTGWYRLDVKMDGKPIGSHRYVISPAWEQQKVNLIRLFRDDGAGGAGEEVEAFAASDLAHHFELQSTGYLKRGAVLGIVYTAVDTTAGKNVRVQATEYEVPADASVFNVLTSFVSLPNDWPTGKYEIAVYDGKRLLGSRAYEVHD